MKREREELIDLLLGELAPDDAARVQRRLDGDPAERAEREFLARTIGLVRAAAAEGWPAPRVHRMRILGRAVAAAAVILVAVGIFLSNGSAVQPDTVYEPDHALGYLLPEETNAAGDVAIPSTTRRFMLRNGSVEISAIGSDENFRLQKGDPIAPESELKTLADDSARVDLPQGGILFLRELSTVQLRRRDDGRTALRVVQGEVCTVADDGPIHIAVSGTDLLLTQESGAALVRVTPAEAICLRGDLFLNVSHRETFRVPAAQRLPAACAKEPATVAVAPDDIDLEWYRGLVYRQSSVTHVEWERPGVGKPIKAGPQALLYLRILAPAGGTLTVSYGGAPRRFSLRKGKALSLRLQLADLGPGPTIEVAPAAGIAEARVFEAVPR